MDIWAEIQEERERQSKNWGGATHDDQHTPNDWIAFIAYHAGRGSYRANFRTQMVKVAALAVAVPQALWLELVVDGKPAGALGGFAIGVRREIWVYLLAIVLVMSAIEWLTYHRRITV